MAFNFLRQLLCADLFMVDYMLGRIIYSFLAFISVVLVTLCLGIIITVCRSC